MNWKTVILSVIDCFIRLRQNTLRLVAGINGEVNCAVARRANRRRAEAALCCIAKAEVGRGYGAISLDTPPLAAGSFISGFSEFLRRIAVFSPHFIRRKILFLR
jgi:hypothetical protein